MAAYKDISISQGHSYSTIVRWETTPIIRKPILAITCPNGAARIQTTVPHGILDGWRAAITNVLVPPEINADNPNRIRDNEYHMATVITPDTVELNDLNIADLDAYTSGGFLQYNTAADLTGWTFRLRMKDYKGGNLLASNLVADAPLNVLSVTTDLSKCAITLTFPVAATVLLAGKNGWYDLEAVSPDTPALVIPLVSGLIKIDKE